MNGTREGKRGNTKDEQENCDCWRNGIDHRELGFRN